MESSEDDHSYSSVHSNHKNGFRHAFPPKTDSKCPWSPCNTQPRRERNIQKKHSGKKEDEPSSPLRSPLFLGCLGVFVVLAAGAIIYICKPCTDDWILFRHKCYLFYDKPAPWKTWQQSRRFCQKNSSDLVVIDDLEEQEFVSKNIKYYHSAHNGYWMGLQNVGNTWTWVNGRADTLGFWMKQTVATAGPKALVVPRRKSSKSWKKADKVFLNKFICERNARLRSN